MKNILYIGPYRQNDTFGEISRSYLRCLKISNNVMSAPIYYTNDIVNTYPYHDDERKKFSHFDCLIQHCLPGDFFTNKTYGKNIGITTIDTYDWSLNYDSISNLNTLDEIWVSSEKEQKILKTSGVTSVVKIIHPSIETNKIIDQQSQQILKNNNALKFYCAIDNTNTEDFESLILAFNLAFNFYDDAVLVISTEIKDIEEKILSIKQKIQFKNRFKKEIITRGFKNNRILSHNIGDCFISCKKNNSFDINLIEALLHGKTPVVNKNIASAELLDAKNSFLIKGYKQPIIVNKKILPDNYDFYLANQYWYTFDVYDLIDRLKNIYEMWKNDKQSLSDLSTNGKHLIHNFTDIAVSNRICL